MTGGPPFPNDSPTPNTASKPSTHGKTGATGKPITAEQTLDLIDSLQPAANDVNRDFHQSLANVVEACANARGIHRQQPTIEIESHSVGIEL